MWSTLAVGVRCLAELASTFGGHGRLVDAQRCGRPLVARLQAKQLLLSLLVNAHGVVGLLEGKVVVGKLI